MNLLLIIPAHNEADNLITLIPHIIETCPQYDYVIINDGSTDNTETMCKERGYNYITLPVNLGIGGAVQTGYRYACELGADIMEIKKKHIVVLKQRVLESNLVIEYSMLIRLVKNSSIQDMSLTFILCREYRTQVTILFMIMMIWKTVRELIWAA